MSERTVIDYVTAKELRATPEEQYRQQGQKAEKKREEVNKVINDSWQSIVVVQRIE